MDDRQFSSLEENLILIPSDVYSIEGIQELNSGIKGIDETNNDIKEEQSSLNQLEDISEQSIIDRVHKPLVQQSVGAKQSKLQFKCKVCGVQSTDLDWFTKHVVEHQQENLPSLDKDY